MDILSLSNATLPFSRIVVIRMERLMMADDDKFAE